MDTLKELIEPNPDACFGPFDFSTATIIIIICCVLGLLWSFVNIYLVNKIDVQNGNDGESDSLVGDIPE